MTETPEITAARIEVERSKGALIATAKDLQVRLSPKTLAREAWDNAKVKSANLAEDAVDAVRKRPVAAGGVVAAIALFLARETIKNLAGRLVNGSGDPDETTDDKIVETIE